MVASSGPVRPEISVIVPAYNARRFVGQTIESVQRQSVAAWELVIVDDGSTDDTALIADEYARADLRISVLRQKNAGANAARNAGLAASRQSTHATLFLDADDVLTADALEALSGQLQTYPSAPAAHGLVRLIGPDGESIRPGDAEAWSRGRKALVGGRVVDWPTTVPTPLAALVLGHRIFCPGAVLIRRSAVTALGGFTLDRRTDLSSDVELWLRLACMGDLAFLDRVVVGYRQHDSNMSRAAKRMDRSRWAVYDVLARDERLTDQQRELIGAGFLHARLLSSKDWFEWARHSFAGGRLLRGANQTRHGLGDLVHVFSAALRARVSRS